MIRPRNAGGVFWRRAGIAGFLFFLVKGLAWLVAAGWAVQAVT